MRIREQIQDLRSENRDPKSRSKCPKSCKQSQNLLNKISKCFKQKCQKFHLWSYGGHLRVVWKGSFEALSASWRVYTRSVPSASIYIYCTNYNICMYYENGIYFWNESILGKSYIIYIYIYIIEWYVNIGIYKYCNNNMKTPNAVIGDTVMEIY